MSPITSSAVSRWASRTRAYSTVYSFAVAAFSSPPRPSNTCAICVPEWREEPLNSRCSMKWLMPALAASSSREPAPIQIPSATDRTERTRSVTIRSPPSSVVKVYRCTGAHCSSGFPPGRSPVWGTEAAGNRGNAAAGVRPAGLTPCRSASPPAAIPLAVTPAARAVALGSRRRRVGLGHLDELLGRDLAALVGFLGLQREADAAAVLVHLDDAHAYLVAACQHLLGRGQAVALGEDPADMQQAVHALAQRHEGAEVGQLDDLGIVVDITHLDVLGHGLDLAPGRLGQIA